MIRLWEYQSERAPVILMLLVAGLSVGVVSTFSSASVTSYLRAVAIVVLYLIQIRTSDEKKDFEHDNEFRKDRPVQRGLVSLKDLQLVNTIAVLLQAVLYLTFWNVEIALIAVASQLYAYLTRKEFYARDWLRERYVLYNITHYVQLAILSYGTIIIMQPVGVNRALLIVFALLHVVVTELGRKMYSEDDPSPDTYSAALGVKGSAAGLVVFTVLIAAIDIYLIEISGQQFYFLAIALVPFAWVLNSAYKYAKNPNEKNSKLVEKSSALFYLASMTGVVFGV